MLFLSLGDMLQMLDEEETAENGRFSCVFAKGFVPLCDVLISGSSYCTECFNSSFVAVIWQQKMYELFFLMLPQHMEFYCFHCCVIFLGSRLTAVLIEGLFLLCVLFLLRSTNEVQSSYEWKCHHLRPAHIAVSVPWAGGRTKHLYKSSSEENLRGGEGNCWQIVVP